MRECGVSEMSWGSSVEISYFVRLGKCCGMGSEHPFYCPPTLRAASAKFLCNESGWWDLINRRKKHFLQIRATGALAQPFLQPYVLSTLHRLLGVRVKVSNPGLTDTFDPLQQRPGDQLCSPRWLWVHCCASQLHWYQQFYFSSKLAAGLTAISLQNIYSCGSIFFF